MSWSDFLLTFVSLFAAALLAFYLESVRERRATRRWVWEYLGFWRDVIETFADEKDSNLELFDFVDAALDRLFTANEDVSEAEWESVDGLLFNSAVSLTPTLLGEASGVVPPDLLRRMFVLDALVQQVRANSQNTFTIFETFLRPLALDRPWPLSGAQVRSVALYRRELASLRSLVESLYVQLDELVQSMRSVGI